jgi:hypothetical protein
VVHDVRLDQHDDEGTGPVAEPHDRFLGGRVDPAVDDLHAREAVVEIDAPLDLPGEKGDVGETEVRHP